MALETVPALVQALNQFRLLSTAQLTELNGPLQGKFSDAKGLARELIQRSWLTPYQVNQLSQGKGQQLLIGPYVVLERLGEGGMAQVFKARHGKLERIVALKVVRKDRLSNTEAVRRFQREIQVISQLAHPNMVAAYDAAQVGESHYIAMEYVNGMDLGRLVKQRGAMPISDACDYIRQAALALQHAFERGLVHRDIKPSNLMLATESSVNGGSTARTVLKVLDLGLARLNDPGDEDASSSLTQPGLMIGTPDFIAPEQARNAHKADHRSDMYSLGCTFYYMLTGQVPFAGGTLTEKLFRHHGQEPPAVEWLRPEIPPSVALVLRKMMAKRPEDRYQTPSDLATALSAAMSVGPSGGMAVVGSGPQPRVPMAAPATQDVMMVPDAIPVATPMEGQPIYPQAMVVTPHPGSTLETDLGGVDFRPRYQPRHEDNTWLIVGAVGGLFIFGMLIFILALILH